ncbi:hypothetical protein LguiA_016145 [Lonicera macranthoides]
MGRKGSWFSSVKKALSPETREKRSQKSKKKWFGKEKSLVPDSPNLETVTVSHPLPPPQEVKLTEEENEQTKHTYSAGVDADVAAEVAQQFPAASQQYTADIIQPTTVTQFTDKYKEELAARKIQTAFRGYLARRALRALRGLVRLKSQVEGPTVKRQTTNTLRCMQTLSRVQSQIQSRRIRMSEENQALQKQLLQKRVKELENLQMGDEWDDTAQSKEQIEAKLLHKYEAAMRRERAMAYSFSHQLRRLLVLILPKSLTEQQTWKKASSRSSNLLFMDPTNPQWGWSWLERWMAARPWEAKSSTANELNNDHSSVKSASPSISGSEITKAYAHHQLNSDKPLSPLKPSHQSPSTPSSKALAKKLKPSSPRGSLMSPDEDSKSLFSGQSERERTRRHSIAGGSSIRDDESMASSPSVPSYMTPTQSAKAKARLQNPLGMENNGIPDKGSTKKRLSFPGSPARPPRRHSGPPKVDSSIVGDRGLENGAVC